MGQQGICKLCGNVEHLRKSHAIPSSFIKETLNSSGWAYTFRMENKGSPEKTGNDIKDYLLCESCEQFLSKTYEHPFITLLKNDSVDRGKASLKKTLHGHTFHFGSKKLSSIHAINFIISIFWRCSLLDIDLFKNFTLPDSCLEWMKEIVIENKKPESRLIGIEINTLTDSTERYSSEALNQIIVAPFMFEDHPRPIIGIIFGGYLFKIIIPNNRINDRHSLLQQNTKTYLAKNQELLEIPNINDTLIIN
ncbi:hypothetical protein GCM10009133_09030 [Cocleimonas flava]|uniref:HNH endonuclease n=1 Tax=Cocleimonas flava TaxID=634765 RepID=A0A4V2P8W1_9GAMM|nr:hypothetical protein [Cocleimonas flava]TCJ87265.1 hypothetical protein EV695_1773 [Cocleimonas flava]